ncbi:MAG TPA: coenzyme F420-0:L-glutamate ligase [Actinomycetota bacterium]|nr:coenzyme F420-0:L-glutamate ligase [Actinomycetota bacterium]
MDAITIIPVAGIPEVTAGDDVAALITETEQGRNLADGDVIVITQKVVSKAEGRMVPERDRTRAILAESVRVLRRSGEMMISETRHGLVCANAGVDSSNVPVGEVSLLPLDPDASARAIRARVQHLSGVDVAVVISDTFGRPWRIGQTNIAIGLAGMMPFNDYRGTQDAQGRDLFATRICVADEIAGAAEIVMGKAEGICAAVVRGATIMRGRGSAAQIPRPPRDDLFR